MARIPVFGPGLRAKSPYVTAKSLQNVYCETRPAGEKASIVGYRTPGLVVFSDFGTTTPIRGGHANQTTNLSYCVVGNVLYEVSGTGVATNRGTLNTSTGRVSIADNGVQVMIVDGAYGYIFNTSTLAFAQITDVDFPANPLTVAYLSRRFVINVQNSSRFYWSAVDDGLTWDALDFSNAESSPDPIAAVWSSGGQLVLYGTSTTEFFGDSGAADSAFAVIKGTANEWGLAARWSVAKYDNSMAMLVQNRMGQVMVAQLAGYIPKKISTPDMDAIINGYATVNDASAYSYMLGGHPMYVISFPGASATWLYDGSTGIWSQLVSYGLTRHRGEFGWSFLTYNLVTDFSDGRLYQLRADTYTDDGDQIESVVTTETIAAPGLERLEVLKLRADMQVGQGTSAVEYPQVGLSVSRDNGNTWGAEMMRDLGPIGQYGNTVEWTRLGTARNFVFRIRVTDPVAFTLVSASVNPED